MNKPKPLPCPFCGKSDSVVLLDESGRLHYVCCTGQKGGCGARTTLCEKEITAVVTWNRRAPLPDNKALKEAEQKRREGCGDCKSGFYMTNKVQHPQYKWCPKCGRDLRGERHDGNDN